MGVGETKFCFSQKSKARLITWLLLWVTGNVRDFLFISVSKFSFNFRKIFKMKEQNIFDILAL